MRPCAYDWIVPDKKSAVEGILELLNEYGTVVYAILFGYCALKSGWLPLFAGYAAAAGALDVALVGLVTFLGGYLGDEARFAVARRFGTAWIERPGRLGRLFRQASQLAHRHGPAYIFLYRYPKGLRTVGALPVGLTDMRWRSFTLLNAGSALLWVFVLVGGGYAFGETFDALGASNLAAFSILLLAVFLVALFRTWRRDEAVSLAAPAGKHAPSPRP